MGRLVFVGLGLSLDFTTKKAIEELEKADVVFMEEYTSVSPELNSKILSEAIGKPVKTLTRRDLEDESGEKILEELEKGYNVALAVIGDPFIATTHIALRLEFEKRGYKTDVVPGISIFNVAISLSGLSTYKFTPPTTIVYPKEGIVYETPYLILAKNLKEGRHTLFLLELDVESKRAMSIRDAIRVLREIEEEKRGGIVSDELIGLGIARAGTSTYTSKAGSLKELETYDFGSPPHTLIIPGKLSYVELEALKVLHRLEAVVSPVQLS